MKIQSVHPTHTCGEQFALRRFFCNTVPAFGAASKVYTPPRMSLDAIRVQTFSYA